MPDDSTRTTLLSRLRDPGDNLAWREFDAQYGVLILAYARRKGLQIADAEDVRQLVMMKLSHSLRTFDYRPQVGRFRNYLFRVVQNAIREWRRQPAARIPAGIPPESFDSMEDEQEKQEERVWNQEWLAYHFQGAMQVVRRLHEPRSLAVFDSLLDGANPAQAAERFAISVEAVHKIKHRILKRMRMLVQQRIREEEDGFAQPSTASAQPSGEPPRA